MIYINRFFFSIRDHLKNLYLNSNLYDKKISKVNEDELLYKPSPYLLSSLIKYQKKKFDIEDFSINEIWNNKNLRDKKYKNLNNFYWFFSLDLKSSKQATQSIITNWINNNKKYNNKTWGFDLTAKRIIAWLSCHNLTYDESNQNYKDNFKNFYVSLFYKGNVIKNAVKKNFKINSSLNINYYSEKKPLGTAGSIFKIISHFNLSGPIMVINSDIMTNINFQDVYDYYKNGWRQIDRTSMQNDVDYRGKSVQIKKGNIKDLNGNVIGVLDIIKNKR